MFSPCFCRTGVAAALAACLLVASCHSDSSVPQTRTGSAEGERAPVVVLGIDGLAWPVVLEMLAADRMPNLGRLMRHGVFGKLATLEPSRSPALWTTVATGVLPEKHGITGFTRPGTEDLAPSARLFTNHDRRTKALWNILDDAGLVSYVIGWWMTFPVEPVRGLMVAQVNTQAVGSNASGGLWKGALLEKASGQVHPPGRESEVLALLPLVDQGLERHLGELFGTRESGIDAVGDHLWKKSRWALRADAIYSTLLKKVLDAEERFDLLLAYFGGPDVLGHRFWRYAYPDQYEHPPSPAARKAYGSVLHDYYAWIDSLIGEIADRLPAEATLLVMSDHGMGARNRSGSFEPTGKGRELISGGHGRASDAFLAAARAGAVVRRDRTERDSTEADSTETDGIKTDGDMSVPLEADVKRLGTLADIAPSILAMFDLAIGRDMDGRPLTEVFAPVRPKPSQRLDPRYVATHTPPTWSQERELADMGSAGPPGAPQRLEQLRALGYIE